MEFWFFVGSFSMSFVFGIFFFFRNLGRGRWDSFMFRSVRVEGKGCRGSF